MAERGPPPRRPSGTELDEAKRSLVAMFGERLAEQPHRARIEQIDSRGTIVHSTRHQQVGGRNSDAKRNDQALHISPND